MSKDLEDDTGRIIFNRFLDFFAEAVYFADFAEGESVPAEIKATLIKTSILYGVFSLEAAANALIGSLSFLGKAESEFDRLPMLGKFELFYFSGSRKVDFDRGCNEVQAIYDLIKFRDEQVHSHLVHHFLKKDDDGHVRFPEVNRTNHLDLPLIPYFLESEHAVASLRAIDSFLEKFFLEWCDMSVAEITEHLFHRLVTAPTTAFPMTRPVASLVESAMDRMGLRLNFLDRHPFNARLTDG